MLEMLKYTCEKNAIKKLAVHTWHKRVREDRTNIGYNPRTVHFDKRWGNMMSNVVFDNNSTIYFEFAFEELTVNAEFYLEVL